MKTKTGLFYVSFLLVVLINKNVSAQLTEQPVIDSVSVNYTSGNCIIGWTYEYPDSVDGYIVYRKIFDFSGITDGSYMPVSIIEISTALYFEDTTTVYGVNRPFETSGTYRIAAYKIVDSERVLSPMSEAHGTVHISSVIYNRCKTTLTWNSYTGWSEQLSGYRIYCKISGQSFQLAGTTQPEDTTFVHSDFDLDNQYIYLIHAIHSDGLTTSSSNTDTIDTNAPTKADTLWINAVEPVSDTELELNIALDPDAEVSYYSLFRSENSNNEYISIAEFDSSQSFFRYTDLVHSVTDTFFYKIEATDICNRMEQTSNEANNIVLTANAGSGSRLVNVLSWNTLNTWNDDADGYRIFRTINNTDIQLIDSVDYGYNSYTDDIESIITESTTNNNQISSFCYYIEAYKYFDALNLELTNQSNTTCAIHDTRVFIPTAINPMSVVEENRIFKPSLLFASNYRMIIYSRWGDIVFETGNMNEGWDGTMKNGAYAKEGAYAYYIKYQNSEDRIIEKTGSFLIIYP